MTYNMRERPLATIMFLAVLAAGCEDRQYTSPTAPAGFPVPPSESPAASLSTWFGDSTVVDVSSTRNGCVPSTIGHTESRIRWEISIVLDKIKLNNVDENANYEFAGVSSNIYAGQLTDSRFTATGSGQDGGWNCFVMRADIAGRFSEDGRQFEAVENIEYFHSGEPPMQVQRRWIGTRR